jgi:CRP-like cAMP-binding protein
MVTLPTARQFLKSTGWLGAIDPALADAVLEAGKLRSFARGAVLCAGRSLHGVMVGIVRGQVAVRWAEGSSDSEIGHIGLPGSWWGASPLWHVPREGDVRARTDVDVLQVDLRDMREIADHLPGGWQALGLLAIDTVGTLATAHDDMMTRNIRQRCILVLLRLSGQRRHVVLPVHPSPVVLTQDELARLANLTRSPVSRILHDLAGRGLIRIDYRSITVIDPKGLAKLAGVD